MENTKISIIVPVFNSAKYLEKCIESLINQSLLEMEFIFIDDGSSDKSIEILNQYKKIDKRIVVIKNSCNKGPSASRNIGIRKAKGKYIGFSDSDDWVEKFMYEKMYELAHIKTLDCVICGINVIKSENNYIKKIDLEENIEIENQKLNKLLLNTDQLNSLSNKIYLSKIVKDNQILLNENIYYGEDLIFNLDFFYSDRKVYYINKHFYNYRKNQNSLSNKYDADMFQSKALNIFKLRKKYLKLEFGNECGEEQFLSMTVVSIINQLRKYNKNTLVEKIKSTKKILENKELKEVIAKLDKISLDVFCLKNKVIIYFILYAVYLDIREWRKVYEI